MALDKNKKAQPVKSAASKKPDPKKASPTSAKKK